MQHDIKEITKDYLGQPLTKEIQIEIIKRVEDFFTNKTHYANKEKFKIIFQWESNGNIQLVPCNLYTMIHFVGVELPPHDVPEYGTIESPVTGHMYFVQRLDNDRYSIIFTPKIV